MAATANKERGTSKEVPRLHDGLEFIVPPYVILSEAAEGGEVEESSHYDDKCGKIGAKILRLRRISYGSAQDDKLVRLNDKLEFEFRYHSIGQ